MNGKKSIRRYKAEEIALAKNSEAHRGKERDACRTRCQEAQIMLSTGGFDKKIYRGIITI